MQKSVVIKQTWAIILMTPHYLLEASCTLAFTLQQGGWITVHKRRFFLKEWLSAVYITLENSASVYRNWILICFATSWGSGLHRNRTFFCEIRAEKSGIIRCKHVKTAKRVLLFVLRGKAFCYWIPLVILAL